MVLLVDDYSGANIPDVCSHVDETDVYKNTKKFLTFLINEIRQRIKHRHSLHNQKLHYDYMSHCSDDLGLECRVRIRLLKNRTNPVCLKDDGPADHRLELGIHDYFKP